MALERTEVRNETLHQGLAEEISARRAALVAVVSASDLSVRRLARCFRPVSGVRVR